MNIPVIGILDTNADPDLVEFPIPGNDDALRAINLYADLFKSTIIEAKKTISIPKEEKSQSKEEKNNESPVISTNKNKK